MQWRVPFRDAYAVWFGAGAGIERMAREYESGCMAGSFSRVDSGFELGHLEVGAGMRVNSGLVIGPLASYAVGLFRTSEATGGCRGGGTIGDPAIHGLFMVGLRGMYTVH